MCLFILQLKSKKELYTSSRFLLIVCFKLTYLMYSEAKDWLFLDYACLSSTHSPFHRLLHTQLYPKALQLSTLKRCHLWIPRRVPINIMERRKICTPLLTTKPVPNSYTRPYWQPMKILVASLQCLKTQK